MSTQITPGPMGQLDVVLDEPLAPSGVPVAQTIRTDITRTLDQAALEEAIAESETMLEQAQATRPGFLMPFIIGFAAAWAARQFKVI